MEDYYIVNRDNEYEQILSTLKYKLDESIKKGQYPTWGETIERLIRDIESKSGNNISNWEFNINQNTSRIYS